MTVSRMTDVGETPPETSIMKKHIHIFKWWAGGTDLHTNKSDMAYECECGEQISIHMSPKVYFSRTFPEKIKCNAKEGNKGEKYG